MGLILLIVLLALLFGALPHYGYSRRWGYRPSGGLGLLLVAVLILLFVGMLPWGVSRPVYVVRPQPVQVVQPQVVRVIQPVEVRDVNPVVRTETR